jgi:hypothetical protein
MLQLNGLRLKFRVRPKVYYAVQLFLLKSHKFLELFFSQTVRLERLASSCL